jgi:hypothetical protein
MLFLLLLSLIGRRFGWKVKLAVLIGFGFYQETRERFYFSILLPALDYSGGVVAIAGGAGMLILGGVIGLVVMRLVEQHFRFPTQRPAED